MALTTFGAIMTFAIDMFRMGEENLNAAAQASSYSPTTHFLQDLLVSEKKDRVLMERVRRENVTEMMLEPINGLRVESYEIYSNLAPQLGEKDLLKHIRIITETELRFLRDSAIKIPLPEVQNIFQKLYRKREQSLIKIISISSLDNKEHEFSA